jgi:hypothetical protein
MIWYIIISIFVATLLWILLGPVIIFLNTDNRRYYLALPGIFKAVVVASDDLFHIRGWIFFIPYKYDPFQQNKKKRRRKTEKPKRKRSSKKLSGGLQLINGVTRSVRIRKLLLDLDTDDFILNAWLIPVFSSVNSKNIRMRVNFEGTSSLLLNLQTRLGTLLWNVLKNKYKSFINL